MKFHIFHKETRRKSSNLSNGYLDYEVQKGVLKLIFRPKFSNKTIPNEWRDDIKEICKEIQLILNNKGYMFKRIKARLTKQKHFGTIEN